jgi:hypothetical protein
MIEKYDAFMHLITQKHTNLDQERLVFVLEEESEAIDNADKDLEQLRNAVMRYMHVKHKSNRFKSAQLRSN